MKDTRKQQIVTILKANDSKGIKFAQTKQQLLEQGYTNQEINIALYEAPYDAKPNQKTYPSLLEKHFKQSPEAADRVAKSLLKDIKSRERTEIATNLAASHAAPGRHAQLFYSLRSADSIGFPFYTVLTLTVVVGVLVSLFDLPIELLYVIGAITAVYVLYLIIKRWK